MKRPPGAVPTAALAVAAALAAAPPAAAGALEDELRARWVGRWVIVGAEVGSDCDGGYTNNRWGGGGLAARGHHRLPPGELARIDNLHLHRARVDLLVALAEPLRHDFRDGPFELSAHLECRAELEVPLPRSLVKRRDADGVETLLAPLADRYPTREAAVAAPSWNGRAVEPLPEGYEETLAEYEAWKEEQLVYALRVRLGEALLEASDHLGSAGDDPSYHHGMLLGARDFHRRRVLSGVACEDLAEIGFRPRRGQPPDDYDDDDADAWQEGYDSGQLLAFAVELAQRLDICLR